MRAAAVLVVLATLASTAAAERALELRVDSARELVEARLAGEPKHEPLFLRDLDRARRVPALEVTTEANALVARFDLRTLAPDGATHRLAVEWADTELARGAVILPAPEGPSGLRWLVIVGPLLGLVMIMTAIWIGRRVVIGRQRRA
jgi:hypothetical protein